MERLSGLPKVTRLESGGAWVYWAVTSAFQHFHSVPLKCCAWGKDSVGQGCKVEPSPAVETTPGALGSSESRRLQEWARPQPGSQSGYPAKEGSPGQLPSPLIVPRLCDAAGGAGQARGAFSAGRSLCLGHPSLPG